MSNDPTADIDARIRELAPTPSNETRERARQALAAEILREEAGSRQPRRKQIRRLVVGLAAALVVVVALIAGLRPWAPGPAEELANRIADQPALTATAAASVHTRQVTEEAVVAEGAGPTAGPLAYRLERSIETVIGDGTVTINRSATATFDNPADEAAYQASDLPQRDGIGTASTTADLALAYGSRWPTESSGWVDLTDPVVAIETLIDVTSDPKTSGAHRAAILRRVSQMEVTVRGRNDSGVEVEFGTPTTTWTVTIDRNGWVTQVIVTDGGTVVRQSTYSAPTLLPRT